MIPSAPGWLLPFASAFLRIIRVVWVGISGNHLGFQARSSTITTSIHHQLDGHMKAFASKYGRRCKTRTCDILLPKQARYQLRYTPIFYFAFFLIFLSARHTANTSRSRHLCYFNISGRVCQADDWAGNCGCSIPTYAYAKKTPPLWLTPGRWYSLGAKISPGTAGWTGSGHRYPAARLRWSCLRSRGAWPAARPPKRLHRS